MRFAPVVRSTILGVFLVVAVPSLVRADVVETKNGARLVGHVTKIADGRVYLDTSYAGTIVIAQTQVASLTTEAPVSVRLADGRCLDGRVSSTNGTVQVTTAAGSVGTTVGAIVASWIDSTPNPRAAKPEPHWTYEASVDLNGRTGNRNQLGSAYGITATMTRLNQKLVLRTAYNRQVTQGVVSTDQFKAGADYSDNYSDKNSWYIRDEAGYDRIRDVGRYNLAATGRGYDFVRQLRQTLTGRLGVAFRYEDYTVPTSQNVRSIAMDLGANYSLRLENAMLSSRLSVVPTFQNLANVRITQETDLDIPLVKSAWKVRLGVASDYSNKPVDALEKLDTTYFGRLVLSWE